MTGTATGIHLHFELLVDGVQVDPYKWLKMNAN
jgi:murein DD-endopeptidase MepM/ murein hydrolase activator NlpD